MGLILVVVPKGVGLMLVVGAEGRGGDVGCYASVVVVVTDLKEVAALSR